MSLRKSLFWSFTQQFGMMFLQLSSMMIIARLLTPDEVGIFIVALSIVTILQSLREMGLTNYVIRAPKLTDDIIRAVFGIAITLCLVLCLGLLLLRGQIEVWTNTPGLAAVLLPVACTILLFPIEQSSLAIIRREMRFAVLARATVMAKFAGVATSIGLALAGMSTMAMVWGYVVDAALRTMFMAMIEPLPLRLGPSIRSWRPVLGFGLWTSAAAIAGQAAVEGNKIMLGAGLGAGATALFDRAWRIPSMARMGLFMPLNRVFVSSFSEDLRAGRDIGPKVEQVATVTSGLVWPGFVVIAILAQEIVALVLGPQWGRSALILPWLLLSQALLALLPQPEQILIPYGQVRKLFALRVWQMLQSLTLSWIALHLVIPGTDQLAVFASSRALSSALFIIVIWVALQHSLRIAPSRILQGHLKSLAVTIATALPVAAWKYAGIGNGSWVVLILALILSACFGLAAGLIVRHPLALELKRGVLWAKNRKLA